LRILVGVKVLMYTHFFISVSKRATLLKEYKVIKCPNKEERRNISGIIRKIHGFLDCIGVMDGKWFPLAFAPMLHAEEYFMRKGDYAMQGLVICDNAARITWIKMGWLGSVHDNQVWSNSEIYLGRDKHFDHKEYLLGDSALSRSAVMAPAFKKATMPTLVKKKSTSTPSWLKLGSRVSTALVYLKRGSNVFEVIGA